MWDDLGCQYRRPRARPDERTAPGAISVHRETVEKTRAARGDQVSLTAASTHVRIVPRRVAAAGTVVMTEARAARGIARPVVARRRRRSPEQHPPERIRPREDVVLIGSVPAAVHGQPL